MPACMQIATVCPHHLTEGQIPRSTKPFIYSSLRQSLRSNQREGDRNAWV